MKKEKSIFNLKVNNVQSSQKSSVLCFGITITKKRAAFTLSEVLITLSILGVIAAVTVPSVIQHYRKAVTVTKLKIAYSTLESAISISEAINGAAQKWDWSNEDSVVFANKYILPYLNHTFLYSATPSGAVSGTAPYSGTQSGRYAIKDLKGVNQGWDGVGLLSNIVWIRLKNGMDIGIKQGVHGWHAGGLHFWVDIDGARKGKNQVGNDIFVFALKIYSGGTHPRDSMGTIRTHRAFLEPGISNVNSTPNMYTAAQVSGTTLGYCNKNAGSDYRLPSGAWCSYVIYQNGWKIPSDYPLKF